MLQVVVIGGGVVGAAAALALARRGRRSVLLEAEPELALGASGTNSGILHTGFDSNPGELETELILRSAALRDPVLDALGVPVLRCGAVLRPRDEDQARTVAALAEAARRNGVAVRAARRRLARGPRRGVTDPVAYTLALAGAAIAGGAEVRVDAARRGAASAPATGCCVERRRRRRDVTRRAPSSTAAGLRADEVAAAGRRRELRDLPAQGRVPRLRPAGRRRRWSGSCSRCRRKRTKGVLVFPTVDGRIVAGPDRARPGGQGRLERARRGRGAGAARKLAELMPALAGAEPIASYAGLRPAGARRATT